MPKCSNDEKAILGFSSPLYTICTLYSLKELKFQRSCKLVLKVRNAMNLVLDLQLTDSSWLSLNVEYIL